MGKGGDSVYWSAKLAKSRNAVFNFIVGNRGGGKTFGFLEYAVDNYLKARRRGEKRQFIYMRRYRPELAPLAITKGGSLFDRVAKIAFPSHDFKAEGGVLWCDHEVCGYAVTLAQAPGLKSVNYGDVYDIGFDEFIIDKGSTHYIRGQQEPEIFLDFYQTVDRDEDRTTAWFMANAITEMNPYFNYFGLRMPKPGKFLLFGNDNQLMVESVADPELIEKKKHTRFGQLIYGTAYGDYSIENKMLRDSEVFVKKKGVHSLFKCTLRYLGTSIGVWFDPVNGEYYLSDSVDKNCSIVYNVTDEDHQPNQLLLHGNRKSPYIENLKTAYGMGRLFFENKKLAGYWRDIVKELG